MTKRKKTILVKKKKPPVQMHRKGTCHQCGAVSFSLRRDRVLGWICPECRAGFAKS